MSSRIRTEVLLFRCEHCGSLLAVKLADLGDFERDTLFCMVCMRNRVFCRVEATLHPAGRVQLTVETEGSDA